MSAHRSSVRDEVFEIISDHAWLRYGYKEELKLVTNKACSYYKYFEGVETKCTTHPNLLNP